MELLDVVTQQPKVPYTSYIITDSYAQFHTHTTLYSAYAQQIRTSSNLWGLDENYYLFSDSWNCRVLLKVVTTYTVNILSFSCTLRMTYPTHRHTQV